MSEQRASWITVAIIAGFIAFVYGFWVSDWVKLALVVVQGVVLSVFFGLVAFYAIREKVMSWGKNTEDQL